MVCIVKLLNSTVKEDDCAYVASSEKSSTQQYAMQSNVKLGYL